MDIGRYPTCIWLTPEPHAKVAKGWRTRGPYVRKFVAFNRPAEGHQVLALEMDWLLGLPPVTKTYFMSCVVITALVHFDIVSPLYL